MHFRRQTWIALSAIIILIALLVIVVPFVRDILHLNFVHIDPLPVEQRPTAEALLDNPDGSRDFISSINTIPDSTFLADELQMSVIVLMGELMENGIDERTLRETIRRTATLEINAQLIAPTLVGEHPPAMINKPIWDEEFYYQMILEEGLYILKFSLETPDGVMHSYTWAYRAVY
ncbi:MAG: hypothetical protein H7175_01185 [Burkholderiales bacterium]|nr:hypothetical protein [Anaerolineae bacterium]